MHANFDSKLRTVLVQSTQVKTQALNSRQVLSQMGMRSNEEDEVLHQDEFCYICL